LHGANGLEAGFISVYERAVVLKIILGGLAVLSFLLLQWQWLVALRFPLHRRIADQEFAPGVTLLKSLKGVDDSTEECLRSWFVQSYPAPVQILFGVASAEDPVCNVVRKLLKEFPNVDAELKVCGQLAGTNAKVSKLIEMERLAKHEVLIISDADVRVPQDLLRNVVVPLRDEKVGLVNCFYRLANPSTTAMQWEAIAINADFWSQVLQSQSLKPLDFALGAVMATRRAQLKEIGGFEALRDCLADDYQLGNRVAQLGHKIALCPVVVECWSFPMDWVAVWKHQLRWARTIRVCQPVPYFFSILSNSTLWPLLWLMVNPTFKVFAVSCGFAVFRVLAALNLQARLTRARPPLANMCLVPAKDLLQTAIWFCAFAGNRVEWRGRRMRLRRDGTLEKLDSAPVVK
jgi:ceramide glucosyltransferase